MSEATQLVDCVKRLLKQRGLTYKDVAAALEVSEASVKRMFSVKRLTLDRLADVARLLGLTVAELAQEAATGSERLRALEQAQERELVRDAKLLLVTVCTLNHWSIHDIVATYTVSETEVIHRLARLDRLRLIDLLPGNRVRLNVARDFNWLPQGPIQTFFKDVGMRQFLASPFMGEHEAFSFTHGMLSEPALAKLQTELRKLRDRFAEFHEESLAVGLSKRRGVGLLIAAREWELDAFQALRRRRP